MGNLKKYEAYKPSSVEWLGEIPEHWELMSNKHIFNLKKDLVGNKSSEYDLLSLTLKGIIKRDMENPQGKFPAEFNTYQKVNKDDFIFCLFDVEETPRCVGLSSFDGMITGAYTVMSIKNEYNSKFLYYFYLNLDKDKRLRPLYTGLRNTISKDNFFSFKTFVPPLSEQAAIAAFLDDKTAKIDTAIAQKEQLIQLLQERKQIMIQEAVTKGIKFCHTERSRSRQNEAPEMESLSEVEMKDSGVEWIGDIPAHWEVKRLANCLNPVSIKNKSELPLLSITREKGIIKRDLEDLESNHNFIPDDLSGYKMIKKGQFGMNKMKAWQGSYGISSFTGIISPAYYIFNFLIEVHPQFFHIAIRSKLYVTFFAAASDGVRIGQWDLSKDRMKKIPIVIPPLSEQKEIAGYIEKESAKIEKAVGLQKKQIKKLKEYKNTLIDSAVRGKVKVC